VALKILPYKEKSWCSPDSTDVVWGLSKQS